MRILGDLLTMAAGLLSVVVVCGGIAGAAAYLLFDAVGGSIDESVVAQPATPELEPPAPTEPLPNAPPAMRPIPQPASEFFDVTLVAPGPQRGRTVQALEVSLEIERAEARELLGSVPVVIARDLPEPIAAALVEALDAVGARADVKASGTWSMPPADDVSLPLTANQVESALRRSVGAIHTCVRKRGRLVAGTYAVELALQIAPGGRVKAARVREPQKLSAAARKCVAREVKRVRFPQNSVASRVVWSSPALELR